MNPAIKEWQLFLKNNPLGISYPGNADGIFTAEFAASMRAFEDALSKKLNKPLQGMFYYAGNIRNSPAKLQEFLPKPPTTPPQQPTAPQDPNKPSTTQISEFKKYLQTQNLFQGKIDEEITQEFTSAIKRLEELIASAIQKLTSQRPNTQGLIWNNKLNTTPQDVDKGLKLLSQQLKAKKSQEKQSNKIQNLISLSQATVENVQNADEEMPYEAIIEDTKEPEDPQDSQQFGKNIIFTPKSSNI